MAAVAGLIPAARLAPSAGSRPALALDAGEFDLDPVSELQLRERGLGLFAGRSPLIFRSVAGALSPPRAPLAYLGVRADRDVIHVPAARGPLARSVLVPP